MTREEAKKEILNRWDSIWELFNKYFDIEDDRLKLKRNNCKQELIFSKKQNRKKTRYLKAIIGEKIFCSKDKDVTDADILIEVIENAGIKSVYELKIPVKKKYYLVGKNTGDINEDIYRIISSEWAVFVKTGVGDKYLQIDKIIKGLNLDASIGWEQ